MSTAALQQRVDTQRRVVAGHKAAIRRHRSQLAAAATELAELERQCRTLGIGFTVVEEQTDGTHRTGGSAS